jgi:hypothetical protein
MAGYLTHLYVLIESEKWLRELERALSVKRSRLEAQQNQLAEFEQRFLDLATRSRAHLSADRPSSREFGREFPGADIENGVGSGISKYATVGSIGPDFPAAANILALNQRWVAETMHKGSPRRAWVEAGSTQFVTNFLDVLNSKGLAPARKKQLLSYLLGHVSSVAAHVLLHPVINYLSWDVGYFAGNRPQIEIALDATLARGYFKREDLHSGESWRKYYLDQEDYADGGAYLSNIQELMKNFLEAYNRTYGEKPLEALCARPPEECRVPKLDVAFLVNGFHNTTDWALDVGYDQSPSPFRFLNGLAMLAGGVVLLFSTWSSVEEFSTLGNWIFSWEQEDNDRVKQTNLAKWQEKGFFANERILLDCLDNAYSWGGYIFYPFSFLTTGRGLGDGMFGQGTTSFFDKPGGVILFKLFKYAYIGSMFAANEAEPHILQEWYFHLPRMLVNMLLEALDMTQISRRSQEQGVEGDLPGLGIFKLQWVVTAFYFFAAALAFSIKSTRKNPDGSRETGRNAYDFLFGLSVVAVGFGLMGWWWRLFDRWLVEEVISAPWPGENMPFMSGYLGVSEDPRELYEGIIASPVRLFPQDKIQTIDDKEAYPQNDDETIPWSERSDQDEKARKDNSIITEGDYFLKDLLEKAGCFSGLLALATTNYDQVPAAQKEKAKLVFKDWNLNYRTEREWRDLLDASEDRPGLINAAELWLEDLKQDRPSQRMTIARVMEVLGEQPVTVKLTGRLLDAHAFDPAVAEPLPNVQIRAQAQAASSNAEGQFELEAALSLGEQIVEIGRSGVESLHLNVEINGNLEGPVTVIVRGPGPAELARITHDAAVELNTIIKVALPDLRLVAHKIRGTVHWPDSRTLSDPNYAGTPLAGKRVYAMPLANGEITAQRPADTRAWSEWRNRPGILASGRLGRFNRGERTDHDGAFEIKFIDLSVGRRYFIWVESEDPVTHVESPEYCVRTFYQELIHLTDSPANQTASLGYHLIDHTYNLTADPIAWGVESLKVVNWITDFGAVEVRAVRPPRESKGVFENLPISGERVNFDTARKIISDYRLQCLPLVPVFETFDRQNDHARLAQAGLLEAVDTRFPRGHFAAEVRFVLDARGIDPAINLQAGVWDGAWNAADANRSRNRRRCELLEKTFIVSPQIPSAHLPRVEDAHWRFDAITLADFALISIPAPPPLGQAVAANRELNSTWVPVLRPALPRLTGLSAGRHLFLAPGHGFFADPPNTANLANWFSCRGGYNAQAGEDENDAYMAAEVHRIALRQGMTVTSVRETLDFTRPGVVHTANNTFNPSANPNFLRLWQQNPVYFLGPLENDQIAAGTLAAANAVVIGTVRGTIANPPHDPDCEARVKNVHGAAARTQMANRLAGGADPIDIFLAIHTNALAGNSRGVTAIFLDVNVSTINNAEANRIGQEFATSLRDQLVAQCHLSRRDVLSLRTNGNPIGDLQNSFDYWSQNIGGPTALRPRVRNAPPAPAGWQHKTFPSTIPAALVEVAFHDNAEDAALLSRSWFRRKAGEAMSDAVEAQLRANPDAVTQASLVRMLQANFGPTAAVGRLPNGNVALIADAIRAAIQDTTGEVVPVGGVNLNSAVTAIETARNAFTRRNYIEGLRDVFAEIAGYDPAAAAEIENFITRTILSGGTLAGLSRPAAPPTREQVGRWLAAAIGWRPVALATVLARQVGGQNLMLPLAGAPHPDVYLPRVEAQHIFTLIRAVDPLQIYRPVKIFLANEHSTPLKVQDGRPPQVLLGAGQRIRIVVNTEGMPWQVTPDRSVQFSISNSSGFSQALPVELRELQSLSSRVWEVNLPTNGIYQLAVAITHRTQADKTLTINALYDFVQST